MNINEAETMAKQLIAEHCPEYTFGWSRGKRMLGICYTSRKLIKISKPYAELNPKHEIKDTVLHEIAHALTPGHHHDGAWKDMCRCLGCTPRGSSKKPIMPEGKYVYECPNCKTLKHKHRRTRLDTSCGTCCKKYNNGHYSSKYMLRLIE